jgi:hypothetical protein
MSGGKCTTGLHEAMSTAEGSPCYCGKYRLYLRTVTRSWLTFRLNDDARRQPPARQQETP